MGRRKALKWVSSTTWALWASREIVGWMFGHTLDALWDSLGIAAWGGTMLTAYQDVLLGIGIGLSIAVLIVQWPLIKVKVRRGVKWTWLFLQIAWKSRPGYRRLTLRSQMKLLRGVQSGEFHTVLFDTSTARFENKSNEMVRLEVARPGVIRVSRVLGNNEDVSRVEFELWGRALFWASIKKAWASDQVVLNEIMENYSSRQNVS
jgi:hypothetical protein